MPEPDFIPDAPDFIADTPDFIADDDPWWKKMAHEKLWATGPSLEQAGTGAMGVIDSAMGALSYPFNVGAEAMSGALGIPLKADDPRRNALGVIPAAELLHIDDPKTRREDPIHRAMAGAVPGALPLASLLEAGGMPELGGRVLDLGAKPAELGLGFATDPSMVLGAGEGVAAIRGAAPLVAGANRALGAAGAVSGGVGALRSGSEAVRAALEGRGWDAAMSGVDALTSGAMGLLGAHGAVAERPGVAETVRDRVAAQVKGREPGAPRVTPAEVETAIAEAPQEAPPVPERTLGEVPLDNVPEALREQSKAVSTKLGRTLADTGVIPEGAIESLPPELQPYAKDIHEDAVLRASSIVEGRDFLERTRATHGDEGPDGVTIAESQTPGSYDVLQRSGGKLVGAAAVRGDGLRMIAGGRAMDSPVSASGIYEVLDSRGVERDDILSVLGAEARRKYAASGSQGAREGAPVAGQGRETPPVPPASPEQAGSAARGTGTPEPAGGAGDSTVVPDGRAIPPRFDASDPYIYEALSTEKPHTTAREAVRKVTRPARPFFTDVEKVPEIGRPAAEMGRRYEQRFERGATVDIRKIRRLKRDLKAAGISEADMIDAREDPSLMTPALEPFVKRFAEVDDPIGVRGVRDEVIEPADWVANHFPHVPEDFTQFSFENRTSRLAQAKNIPMSEARALLTEGPEFEARVKKYAQTNNLTLDEAKTALMGNHAEILAMSPFEANLQVRREGSAGPYVKNLDIYEKFLLDAHRKFADTEVFGKNGKNLNVLVDGANREGVFSDRAFLKAGFNRLRGLPPSPNEAVRAKVSSQVRGAKAWSSLGLSVLSQAAQSHSTVMVGGLKSTAMALWKQSTGGRGVRGLKTFADNWREAGIEAAPSLVPNISQELTETLGSKGWFGKKGGKIRNFVTGHLRATEWGDKAMRVIANHTAEEFGPRILKRAQAGDRGDQRLLKLMRIDWQKMDWENGVTADGVTHKDIFKKAFSDYVQLRGGVSQSPGVWSTSPEGKMAFQFANMGYQQVRLVADMTGLAIKGLGDVAKGDMRGLRSLAPLTRGAVAASIAGNVVGALKDAAKGYGILAEDPGSWEEAWKRFRKGRRVPMDYGPIWIAQGLALSQALGLLDDVVNKASHVKGPELIPTLLAGPSYEAMTDVGKIVGDTANKGIAAGAKTAGAAAIKQFPIWGREAARELSAKPGEYPERPGLVGRTRDVLQGAQDVRGAIRGGFLTGERSQRRQDSERARMTAEDVAARVKAREEILPPSVKSPEEKQASRVKRLTREEHLAKVIDAIRNGDEDEYRNAIREAARDRVRFSQRYLAGIRRRLGGNEVSQ